MAVKKITKRWLFNSFGVIWFILMALEIGCAVGIRSYYYSSVRAAVSAQANVTNTLFNKFYENSAVNYSQEIRTTVENFEHKNKMELMLIDNNGTVAIASSGFEPTEKFIMPDFNEALASGNFGEYQGDMNNENILAMSYILPQGSEQYAAMRYVVSLSDVDNQIVVFIGIVTVIGFAIIFFVIMSSSYFINSIVIPVGEVGKTARKIASGDFGVRLNKKNDDEIGELCDVINYMAEELSTAERIKNDFISSVSHELRTPLTAIKGWGETLLDSSTDTDTIQKGMHVIISETERLSQMVEELLDFSKIQSGRMNLIKTKIDLLAELGEAILMFTERAKRENISLLYDEPDLFVPIMGDKNRLRQVFVNVIDNALKYSDNGDTITVTAYLKDKFFYIVVTDTGIGISEEDLPKIKTKFFKANSTRRGSGIGLAVANDIVALHGGEMIVTSQLGVGTTVTVSIPQTSNN